MDDVELLLKRVKEDSSVQGELFAKLLSSDLYVLSGNDAPDEEVSHIAQAEENISIVSQTTQDGDHYIPIFTTLEQLQVAITGSSAYTAMQGITLLEMVYETNICINPASEDFLFLYSDDIKNILSRFHSEKIIVDAPRNIEIGLTADKPVVLQKALAEVFEKNGHIHSAYLALVMDSGNFSFIVGLVMDDPDYQQDAIRRGGIAAQAYLPESYSLDFFIIENSDDEMSAFLINEGDAFYVRSKNPMNPS